MSLWLVLPPCTVISVMCASTHPVTERGFIFVTIVLVIEIVAITGECSMEPTIFTYVFHLRGSFLVVVLVEFVFNVFTYDWRDFIISKICNYKVSFALIVALSTEETLGDGCGIYSWYALFGGVLSSARDTSFCIFCTYWRTLPAMKLAWWNAVLCIVFPCTYFNSLCSVSKWVL